MSEHSEELLHLVDAARLRQVGFTEIAARFAPAENADLNNIDVSPAYALRVQIEPPAFRLTVRVEVSTDAGPITVEAFADYVTEDDAPELTNALLISFANEVGLMVLLPYIRQAISDVTQRVYGNALLMPVIARGSINFSVDAPAGPRQGE